jgi:tetracycline resistance efflux pump
MAVMIPLAVPMVIQFLHVSTPTSLDSVAILIPIIGAILSGSIAGPHLSPIADNMVMASTSSGSHHLDHVQTQVMYVLPAIIGTGIAFLVIGHLSSHWPATYALIFALLSGLLSSFLLLTIFDRLDRTRIKKS